jgi:large subunit ribosomal protein L6e
MAPKKAPATSRNPLLTKGVGRYSRTAMYTRNGRFAIKNKKITKKAETAPVVKTKQIGGKQNGQTRKIAPKASRFYPADDVPQKLANSKRAKPAKLRASITPGTVLILLAGRFRGKRVVFLKQLASGMLLVTGPYAINGVPLRRVNQAYVVATQTKLDISGVTVDAKFDDAYFRRPAKAAKKKTEDEFFASEESKPELSPERKADQKKVDSALMAIVKKTDLMKQYLNARFSLTKYQAPHELVF